MTETAAGVGAEQKEDNKSERNDVSHFKTRGNDYFRAGNYPEALHDYETAAIMLVSTTDADKSEANQELLNKLNSNIAFAHFKMGSYAACIANCNKMLHQYDRDRSLSPALLIKTWTRRGQAHMGSGAYDEAKKSFAHALKLDPENAFILPLFHDAKRQLKQNTAARQEAGDINNDPNNWFQNMFNQGGNAAWNPSFYNNMPTQQQPNAQKKASPRAEKERCTPNDPKMRFIIDQWFRVSTDHPWIPPGLPEMIITFQGGTFYSDTDDLESEVLSEWAAAFSHFDTTDSGRLGVKGLIKLWEYKQEELTVEIRDKVLKEMRDDGYMFRVGSDDDSPILDTVDNQPTIQPIQSKTMKNQFISEMSKCGFGLDGGDTRTAESDENKPPISKGGNSAVNDDNVNAYLRLDEFLIFVARWKREPPASQCRTN